MSKINESLVAAAKSMNLFRERPAKLTELDFTGYSEGIYSDTEEQKSYLKEALHGLKTGVQFIEDSEWDPETGRWKLETSYDKAKITIHSLTAQKMGKMLCLKGDIEFKGSVDKIINELYSKIDTVSQWNPNIAESRQLVKVGKQTDVMYRASQNKMFGVLDARDTVLARCWRKIGDYHAIGMRSVDCPEMPPAKGFVRSLTEFEVIRLLPGKNDTVACLWVCQEDWKGFVPKSLGYKATSRALVAAFEHLRQQLNPDATVTMANGTLE